MSDTPFMSLDTLLELVIFGIIFIAMFAWLSQLDVSFVQKTYLVQNVGMIAGLASFFPGTLEYSYVSSQDESLLSFFQKTPELSIQTSHVIFYSDVGSEIKDEYRIFLLDSLQQDSLILKKESLRLAKRPGEVVLNADPLHQQLFCNPSANNFTFFSAYGGEEDLLYREGEVLGSILDSEIIYEGFNAHYLIDSKEGYPSHQGDTTYAKLTKEILDTSTIEKDLRYFHEQEFDFDDLVLSFSDGGKRYVIGYYPDEKSKGGVCSIIQSLLLSGVFEGGNIVPTKDTHSSIVFSFGDDPTFYSSEKVDLISQALTLGATWE